MEIVEDEYNLDCEKKIAIQKQVEQEINRLEEKRNIIYEMREDGSYSREDFLKRKKQIDDEIDNTNYKMSRMNEIDRNRDRVIQRATHLLYDLAGEWRALTDDRKRMFNHIAFPEGIPYKRNFGFRTPKFSCILDKIKDLRDSKVSIVAPRGKNLNQIKVELARIASFYTDTRHKYSQTETTE
jgi:hypothetical protein